MLRKEIGKLREEVRKRWGVKRRGRRAKERDGGDEGDVEEQWKRDGVGKQRGRGRSEESDNWGVEGGGE